MVPLKKYTLSEMKDQFIGKVGTKSRNQYECNLRVEVLAKLIKSRRKQ